LFYNWYWGLKKGRKYGIVDDLLVIADSLECAVINLCLKQSLKPKKVTYSNEARLDALTRSQPM
jgi:hypothetical protein